MAHLLIDVLYHYRKQLPYLLHEFVIMPDHFHVLLTIGPEITIEQTIQRIKGGFSYRVRKELGLAGAVWERGFTDHRIRDEQDFDIHRVYTLQNPVRKGLAVEPQQYCYCSAFPGFEVDRAPAPAAKAATQTG